MNKKISSGRCSWLFLLPEKVCGFYCQGGRAIILEAGYDASKGTSSPSVVTKPQDFTATDGKNPGELAMSVKGSKAVRSFLFQCSVDPENPLTPWVSFPSTTSKYVIKNLLSAKLYYCRVAAVGSKNQMVFSDIITRVVQ